jgi:EAL and modified HD-GYP domain-containing signal transduction protein
MHSQVESHFKKRDITMDQHASFDVLKTFSGLLYRQPIFSSANKLKTIAYYVGFLNWDGTPLSADTDTPEFISILPELLHKMCQLDTVYLEIPSTWLQALPEECHPSITLILISQHEIDDSLQKPYMRLALSESNIMDSSHADCLLVDITKHDPVDLQAKSTSWLQHFNSLLLCNVDLYEQSQFITEQLPCSLKGHFYTQAIEKKPTTIETNYQILLQLLVELQDPDITIEQLAETINHDVGLSYKLLRFINSAFFGIPREISNIKQAIVLLGQNKIKTWASLLVLSGVEDKPNELKLAAMLRAKMCEYLAKYYKGDADTFFAAGLFSTIDALMNKPLSQVVEQLPLSSELSTALIEHKGPAGLALNDVINYEQARWDLVNKSPIPIEILARIYLDALDWTDEVNKQLTS